MKVLDHAAAAAVIPRAAATTLVVRDGAPGLEVLMVRRSMQASFMPGAYVFPGGAVDSADASAQSERLCDESVASLRHRIGTVTQVGDAALGYAVAALRECFEECGLWLGASAEAALRCCDLRVQLSAGESMAALAQRHRLPLATSTLQPWSHWVTPFGVPKRFDTLFLVAPAPAGQTPEVDAGETTALEWVQPAAALSALAGGTFQMEFATVRTVESLLPYASVAEVLAEAHSRTALPPLHPRLLRDAQGRMKGVLLPGQQGYDGAMRSADI
jgi:8-oxo-dGTP pyrophosphatase MutT (NUDIX family)